MAQLTFHPFPRLPLELRQRIWELGIEPRKVVVGRSRFLRCPRSPPPPLLHACAESRSYLQKYYRKAFVYGNPSRYSWVNFDNDTIYMMDYDFGGFPADIPFIRWLVLESSDAGFFYYQYSHPIQDATALETFTILDVSLGGPYDKWWAEWDSQMELWYFGGDAVTFSTRIRNADDPDCVEITQDNYLKVERDARRKRLAENPSPDSEAEISDGDDEDMCRPGRFRTGWRHVEGCKCTYKR